MPRFYSLFIALWLAWMSNMTRADELTLSNERQQQLLHLLTQDCGSCHGMTLKGGLGPALLPENLKDKSLAYLVATITYGRPNTAMPPWQELLTDTEILWLSTQLLQGVR